MVKISITTLIIILLAIFFIFVIALYNLPATYLALSKLNLFFILIGFVIFIIFTVLRVLPVSYLIHKARIKMGVIPQLLISNAFFCLQIVPSGFASMLSFSHLDDFKKNSKFESLGMTISLSSAGFLSLALIALISSILVSKLVVYTTAILAVFYVFISLVGRDIFLESVMKLFKKIEKKVKSAKKWEGYFKKLIKNRSFLSQRDILAETVLFIPALIFEGLIIYVTLLAFGLNIGVVSAIFIFAFSDAIGVISFIPLGLGSMDVSAIALMLSFGVPGAIALSTMVIFRFFNTVLVITQGYVSMLILDFRKKPVSNKIYKKL